MTDLVVREDVQLVDVETGEVLPDDLASLAAREAVIDGKLRALGPLYGFRDELRVRIAELRGPAELPRPRFRTDKQMRVSECPRCGHRPEVKS